MGRREWALLGLLASVWGGSYLLIKIGLEDLSPAAVVFLRTALAALVLAPVALARRAFAGLREQLGVLALLAAIQVAGPFVLITAGEQEISSSLAGILVASAPIFTALLAIRLDQQERVHGWSLAGVVLGLAGVALLLGVDTGGGTGALVGGLLVVLASLGYAVGGFILKRRLSGRAPLGIVTATMALSAAMVLPFTLVDLPESAPGAGPLAAVALLGVLGTGLAFALFYTLIAEIGPTKASLVAYIAPGFAVIYGVVLLDESFTLGTLSGLVMIVGGSYLAAEGRPRRRLEVAPAAPLGSEVERSAA